MSLCNTVKLWYCFDVSTYQTNLISSSDRKGTWRGGRRWYLGTQFAWTTTDCVPSFCHGGTFYWEVYMSLLAELSLGLTPHLPWYNSIPILSTFIRVDCALVRWLCGCNQICNCKILFTFIYVLRKKKYLLILIKFVTKDADTHQLGFVVMTLS